MRILPQLLAATLLLGPVPALAHDYSIGALEITQPWARATPPGASAGGGFLTITNEGDTDRLIGAASPIAGRVELHEMKVTGGIMKMRPLPDGIEIPAGETVELKPGDFHVMFLELAGPIEESAPVPVTLTFEKAGTIAVEMVVAPPGAPGPDAGHDHEGGH